MELSDLTVAYMAILTMILTVVLIFVTWVAINLVRIFINGIRECIAFQYHWKFFKKKSLKKN